jgi:hypothetical protein
LLNQKKVGFISGEILIFCYDHRIKFLPTGDNSIMNKEKATEFVIRELGKHHNRNEIITALCEQMGLNWREAGQFVQEIESQHGRAIAARQSPIIIILGIGLLIAGIGITCYNSIFFLNFFQSRHDVLSVDNALEMRAAYYRAGSLVVGISMIVGGIVGSWETISKLLKE